MGTTTRTNCLTGGHFFWLTFLAYPHTLPHCHQHDKMQMSGSQPIPHIYVNMMKDTLRASPAPTIFKLSDDDDDDDVDTEVRLREEQVKLQWRAKELQQQSY